MTLQYHRHTNEQFSHSKALTTVYTAIIILLTIQLKCLNCNAILLKCPLYQMHLQKIVGFRPPIEYLKDRNLIYSPHGNYKEHNRYTREGYPITEAQLQEQRSQSVNGSLRFESTASSECWRICNEDDACLAYVHLLDVNECYGYSFFEKNPNYMAVGNDLPLVADGEAVFYEKTCLKVPESCKQRLWTLTKIPGNSLVFQGKKTISTLVTRRECAEKCLFEHEFQCLSASFAPSHRNNHERFIQDKSLAARQHQSTLGRCILSDKDKMIQPDAFRAAPYDEEYIENQCYERPVENDQCSYELYANSTFLYAETMIRGLNQKECQSYCSHETRFYCQGVSFNFEGDLRNTQCLLHSEDIISMGPRSLKQRENSVYMRRVKCLDVQVLCTHNEMSIRYTPKDWFQGKMYVSMHSKECMVQGNGTKSTMLRLPIGSEAKENKCGILRAYEVTKDYQRIFISTLVVIQNNPNVQTQGDRLIKVGCIMSNSTLRERRLDSEDNEADIKLHINSGNGDDDVEDGYDITEDKNDDNSPNAIALESSLEFAHSFPPNEGSLHFNASDFHPTPKITLQIIDLAHDHQTNDVQIGQGLELQIAAEYTAQQHREFAHIGLPALPDFRATSLIAKTLDKQNYVQLLDTRGCPTDVTVFPGLERVRTPTKNILKARFHAFKFAGTSMVNFDVRIHFCTSPCPEDNCQSATSGPSWYAITTTEASPPSRHRRQVPPEQSLQQFKIQNPVYISTVMDIVNLPDNENTTSFETSKEEEGKSDAIPLNFNLRVRGPDNTNSNSFIYGERGVLLIAGIDDQLHMESICMNQSLLIALLIFWLIFQIGLMFSCCFVIQKYKRLAMLDEERRKIHESLEYLEGRRVHWADQGGYTL
uniref:ZP domain-containing protein n=1 Tax=Stomoxys calcitrans TaxID=35570 RepID=A0A1I8NR90_STOCA